MVLQHPSSPVRLLQVALSCLAVSVFAAPGPIRSGIETIPSWKVQSTSKVGNDISKASDPRLDTSSWYTIKSKATLMLTLLENNVYDETHLFFSDNLKQVDTAQFKVPWLYRADVHHDKSDDFVQLKTNGISSRADVYLNGELLGKQIGAYVGKEYDISKKLRVGKNTLLVRVYPTDYNRDFALGFVDWNPAPPDNGTGIWRDVQVKRSGAISLSQPRITAALDGNVEVFVDAKNLDSKSAHVDVACIITGPNGKKEVSKSRTTLDVDSKKVKTVSLKAKIQNPQVWWPKQWGKQPLYSVQCDAHVASKLSDRTPSTSFGIRTVTSKLSALNDTTFFVNDQRFQVVGAGYTSDMFLRFDEDKLRAQLRYVLDMGMNTIRLEGKQEHPLLYQLTDQMGIMLIAGWECCDKWEGWSYNEDGSGEKWSDEDYDTAGDSMRHEAEMMQSHPSMLGFLVGSDYWPDDRATETYVEALKSYNWNTPILASASQRGSPDLIGNGGMRMEGPYDYVPPNYWYNNEALLGAAAGFGSELGAGVGTPEKGSLDTFLSASDLSDLWKQPDKGLYHMSTNISSFYTRSIYNEALWARYGAPSSLDDYLLKAQMMDYEATRAQFEAYLSRWNAERPATGLIYWMLNNAWPSLHWNLFDYYLHPGGSYFGTKAAAADREHALYDYPGNTIYLVNRYVSGSQQDSKRAIDVEVLSLSGKSLAKKTITATTTPNSSQKLSTVPSLPHKDVTLLRLTLRADKKTLSTSTYWLAPTLDELNWDNSTWYHTPISRFSSLTAFAEMEPASVRVRARRGQVELENTASVPAVFVRLNLVDGKGRDVVPVLWGENYLTLWPGEKKVVKVEAEGASAGGGRGWKVEISGRNVEKTTVKVEG